MTFRRGLIRSQVSVGCNSYIGSSRCSGIERRADALMLVENDEVGLSLMKEVEQLWLVWNSGYRLCFDDKQKQALELSKQ